MSAGFMVCDPAMSEGDEHEWTATPSAADASAAAREASAIATGIDVDDLRIYDPEPSPEIARLTAERDALAKRVEALRAGAREIVRSGSYLERKYAEKMIAADDKAASS